MLNMGYKPYTDWMKNFRATRLAEVYSQYDRDIVMAFSMTSALKGKAAEDPLALRARLI